jgi:hypothetical protein
VESTGRSEILSFWNTGVSVVTVVLESEVVSEGDVEDWVDDAVCGDACTLPLLFAFLLGTFAKLSLLVFEAGSCDFSHSKVQVFLVLVQ